MATSDKLNLMASSSSRPLGLRLRADISFERHSYQGRDYWVAKDPVGLKYYRFEDEEYALLKMLDGSSSPDQIKRRFDYVYAPQKITMQELFQFIGSLYRSCILVSDATGQGIELKSRARKKRGRELKQAFTNILAIRFKGFDPDRILTVLDRWTWWFFTWPAFAMVMLLGASALGLVVSQFEQLSQKLPAFHEFFAAENWGWLMLTMGITKICHEFAHGLACKRFGGQCHEMGVMLLVLTPCLYCNVSDSWMLPNKWKRAFIAAAGMYIELVLSSIAVFVWWFSLPGLVNQLALNIVVVSSVSTILFNANPLLRYDGYYILSDLLEIPNMRQKATVLLQRMAGHWLLGIESPHDPFLPTRRKWFFIAYSLAAVAYRWLITFSIFWFLYQMLEPYGAKIIGQLIAMLAIWGLLGMPLVSLYKYFSVPGRFGAVKPVRTTVSACLLVVGLAGVMLIPIPHYVYCHFYVQPQNVQNVYVDVPGVMKELYVQPNGIVFKGDPILRVESSELLYSLARLEGQARFKHVSYLATSRNSNAEFSMIDDVETAKAERDSAIADLRQREKDVDRLIVKAPISGVLLAPPFLESREIDASDLQTWFGTPLEMRNKGAYLQQRTLVGRIVPDPAKMEAVLAIDQGDIEFVKKDQVVEMFLKQLPTRQFDSVTRLISPTKMKNVPKALSSRYGGSLVTTVSKNGSDVPQSTTYLVSVPFNDQSASVVDGATGFAKIRAGSQTVGRRVWRLVCRTFQFEL